jgi:AcrR family transcriptional regulator
MSSKLSTDPRERILATTRRLLKRQEGEVTVAAVAAAAHVSRATLYRYFADKRTLLRAAGAGHESAVATGPRERILEAALALFAERGIHAATLSEIASRAGLSLSGLHWHFKNKDQLVAGLAQHIPILPALTAEVALAESEEVELATQLTRIAGTILEFAERHRGLMRFLLFEIEVYPEVARLASAYTIGRGLPLLNQLFAQHAQNGRLRPGSAQVRAQAFMGMFLLLAFFRPALSPLLAPDDRQTAREYIDILLYGILSTNQGG